MGSVRTVSTVGTGVNDVRSQVMKLICWCLLAWQILLPTVATPLHLSGRSCCAPGLPESRHAAAESPARGSAASSPCQCRSHCTESGSERNGGNSSEDSESSRHDCSTCSICQVLACPVVVADPVRLLDEFRYITLIDDDRDKNPAIRFMRTRQSRAPPQI